jgi:hypothetical protein
LLKKQNAPIEKQLALRYNKKMGGGYMSILRFTNFDKQIVEKLILYSGTNKKISLKELLDIEFYNKFIVIIESSHEIWCDKTIKYKVEKYLTKLYQIYSYLELNSMIVFEELPASSNNIQILTNFNKSDITCPVNYTQVSLDKITKQFFLKNFFKNIILEDMLIHFKEDGYQTREEQRRSINYKNIVCSSIIGTLTLVLYILFKLGRG